MKTPSRSLRSAFSLIELLVVMAIIGILAAAGSVALSGNTKSIQGSAMAASTLFGLARTEAILRNEDVLVLVDTSYNSARPENYLRRMTLVTSTNNGATYEQISRWTTLPDKAFYNVAASGLTNAPISVPNLPGATGSGPYSWYRFKPNGQTDRAKFVLSTGSVVGGTFQETGESFRSGFQLHKFGKQTFYADASSIPQP